MNQDWSWAEGPETGLCKAAASFHTGAMKANRVPRPAAGIAVRTAIRVTPAVLVPALLAACAAPPPPQVSAPVRAAPVAPPPAPPAPPPPADWRDAGQSPGTWRWSISTAGRSTASFGQAGQAPLVTLSCDRPTRTTILWTTGPALPLTGEPLPLVLTTTDTRRLMSATPSAGGGLSVRFAPGDPLLDGIAFSRGRFMLESAGSAPLYLPSWPELSRVIEDCRRGDPGGL